MTVATIMLGGVFVSVNFSVSLGVSPKHVK